jgi:hypothetical protein
MFRGYQVTPEVIAWHEAGHVVAREWYGLPWIEANINPAAITGQVIYSRNEPISLQSALDDLGVSNTSPHVRNITRRSAAISYAGVAAELLLLRRPFKQEYFECAAFDDFFDAARMLRLTDCESDWSYCAELAYTIVALSRGRVEALAKELTAHGVVRAEVASNG